MNRAITFITDFGSRDAYAGIMKGVIMGINPGITMVDITHEIEPQNITQAAYVLHTTHPYFPPGTIHIIVVDPGVGTSRNAIMLKTDRAYFVAPDNGVLSYVIDDMPEAVRLTNHRFWLNPVSATFHGRDIFAPVAAHLSRGIPLNEFGEPTSSLVSFPYPQPNVAADGTITGMVMHIDRFGNLITDLNP